MSIAAPPAETAWIMTRVLGFGAMAEPDLVAVLEAATAFAEARVDLVLSGHIHAPFVWPYPCGDRRTYAVGAGTLSRRERGVAAGFNVLDIEKAAIKIAALQWTGSHFEPFRTWSLDRRGLD